MSVEPGVLALLVGGGVALGFVVGRFTSRATTRLRELASELEGSRKQQSQTAAELEAARLETQEARREHEAYQGEVQTHFSGASNLIRDLTLQYRAVYEHYSEAAGRLCPEGFQLEAGPPPGALPSETESEESPKG